VISISKSTNPSVRTNSINIFKALLTLHDPQDPHGFHKVAVSELLSLPKAGKTAGPEHRIALYSMLSFLPPAEGVSATLVQTTSPLLSKEASEAAISVLASALPPHIVFLIRHSSVPSETVQVIAKEMANAKPAVRKAFVRLAGSVFLGDQSVLDTESGAAFARVLLPSFESCLKTVSSNPLNTGPLEGYVSATVLLGAFAKSKEFGSFKFKSNQLAANRFSQMLRSVRIL
jgi:hypothetical protein